MFFKRLAFIVGVNFTRINAMNPLNFEKDIQELLHNTLCEDRQDFFEDFVKDVENKTKNIALKIFGEIKDFAKEYPGRIEVDLNFPLNTHGAGFLLIRKFMFDFFKIRIENSSTEMSHTHYNDLGAGIFVSSCSKYKLKAHWGSQNIYIYNDAPLPIPLNSPSTCSTKYTYDPAKQAQILWDACLKNQATDFQLVMEGKTLFVHKALLQIKVPYFASLFESQMQECRQNSLILHNSYEEIKTFIDFVYTGKVAEEVSEDINLICDLVDVAEKFQFEDLKLFCCDRLVQWIMKEEDPLDNPVLNQNYAIFFRMGLFYNIEPITKICLEYAEKSELGLGILKSLLDSNNKDVLNKHSLKDLINLSKTYKLKQVKKMISNKLFDLIPA